MTQPTDQSSREQDALKRIVALDPEGVRGDDLGLAVRIAREALSSPIAITAEEAGREGEPKDAARYRWLRHGDNDERVLYVYDEHGSRPFDHRFDNCWLPRNEKLDEAIDAAMLPSAPAQSEGQG